MTATAKYLFDNDFSPGVPAKATIPLADHAAKIAQAEQTAYRNGQAAAEAKLQADAKRNSAALLTKLVAGIEEMQRGFTTLEARLESEAIEVAAAVARKLAPALIAREPFAEIGALLRECFRHLVGAPHVVVRINDALYAEAETTLAGIARERGFDGRLVVLAEPDIAPGDCRIEWADGGVIRDRSAADAAIAELIARYLAGRHNADTATPAAPQG